MRWRMAAAAVAAGLAAAGGAGAECRVARMAELPVTMEGRSPVITVKVNGEPQRFIADSGAFFSSISPGSAAQMHLKLDPAPFGMRIVGVNGGTSSVSVATVKTFTLDGVDIPKVEFIVAGSEVGAGAAGLIGQNVWHVADVEYDLGGGFIRLMKPSSDCRDLGMAYWAGDKPVNVVSIEPTEPRQLLTIGEVTVNGRRLRAIFDTGANTSMMSSRAAAEVGLKPGGPGVTPGGYTVGVGRGHVRTYIGAVDSFQIGDEKIQHTKLRFGDMSELHGDMLVGADFFLSHRVFVANSQRRLYFTYSGGPVFDLTRKADDAPPPPPAAPAVVAQDAAATPTPAAPGDPTDADGFSRRGSAAYARNDYAHALADFDRATALNPQEPRYFEQRARAHVALKQLFLAMADYDAVLKLSPQDGQARVARAALRLGGHDLAGAREDLDTLSAAAPKEADLRLVMGQLYGRAELYPEAAAQFDQWIAAHPQDNRYGVALYDRCQAEALQSPAPDRALPDCNAAVRATSGDAGALAMRAVVRLRRADETGAQADADQALKAQPKAPFALYVRSVVHRHKGETAAAFADEAAAVAAFPKIKERAKHLGLPS